MLNSVKSLNHKFKRVEVLSADENNPCFRRPRVNFAFVVLVKNIVTRKCIYLLYYQGTKNTREILCSIKSPKCLDDFFALPNTKLNITLYIISVSS